MQTGTSPDETAESSMIYAGIGSRKTPDDVLQYMRRFGRRMAQLGWTLRSGRAPGADLAFEAGASEVDTAKLEIYLPWREFGSVEFLRVCPDFPMRPGIVATADQFSNAVPLMEAVHPRAKYLQPSVRKLHTRNVFQTLGASLKEPVNFVICWTPDGANCEENATAKTGGTRTAIVLAQRNGIPVVNMARPDWRETLQQLADQFKSVQNEVPR